jgi:hypothetical protein
VKKVEKNDEMEEEADSNSDIISINSDFFNADDIEVEGWKKEEGGAENAKENEKGKERKRR